VKSQYFRLGALAAFAIVGVALLRIASITRSPSTEAVKASADSTQTSTASHPTGAELPERRSVEPQSEPGPGQTGIAPVQAPETPASATELILAKWKKQIEQRVQAFNEKRLDVDRAQELVLECVLAQMELNLDFQEHPEGERVPWTGGDETQSVMRTEAGGTKSYSIRRSEYPLYFEVVKYFDPSRPDVAMYPLNTIPKSLSERVETYAQTLLEQLK
jgi:hypothetical protein